MNLRRKALEGLRFQFYLKIIGVILSQVSAITLAVILTPRDFAIFGVAMVFVGLGGSISEFGLGSAVIQSTSEPGATLRTATVLRLIMASGVSVSLLVVAPWIALIYQRPALTYVIWALCPVVMLNFVSFFPRIDLTKSLRFKRLFIPEAVAGVAGMLSGIAFAIAGYSFWSLVITATVSPAIYAIAMTLLRPWRPSMRLKGDLARQLLRFGGQLSLGDLLFLVFGNVGIVVLGLVMFDGVGYFLVAYSWTISMGLSLFNALDNVMFPVLSTIQMDKDKIRRGYLLIARYLCWAIIPLGFLTIIVAPTFVSVLLGTKWIPSIPIIQVLGFAAIMLVLALPYQSVATAVGRPREILLFNAIGAAVISAVSPPMIHFFGVMGLAASFLLASGLLFGWVLSRLRVIIGPISGSVLRVSVAPVLGSICFAVPILLAQQVVAPSGAFLVLEVGLAIATYVVAMGLLTHGNFIDEVRQLTHSFIRS